MRSLTFVIEGDINIQITVTELADGSLRFDVELLSDSGLVGDLRALYFDVNDESLLGGLSVSTGDDVTAEKYAANAINYVDSRDTNVNGEVIKEYDEFDAGIEFGTSGTGSDDIGLTSFVLSHPDGLTLELISQMEFGARITSVGEEDASRTDGLKLGGTSTAAPDGIDDTFAADEDTLLTSVNVLDNDTDLDSGDTLSVVKVNGDEALVGTSFEVQSDGGHTGLLTIAANGEVSFDAQGNFEHLAQGESDQVTITYRVHDGNGGYDTATATITIEGANDGPVVSAAVSAVAGEDAAAFAVDLLDGASDADTSDTLNVSNLTLVSGDASGVTVDGNSLDVDPTAYNHLAVGESEVVSYSYDVIDGNGGSAGQTATITIEGANDAPVVSAAVSAVAGEDVAAFAVDLLDGASDADTSDTLNVSNLTLVSGDASGVTVNGNSLDVDPTAYNHLAVGESEVVSYSYDVTDGNGGSAGQTATITIEGANDGPVVSAAVSAVAGEDAAAFAVDLLDGASDADTSDTLNVSNLALVSGDASGVTVDGNSLDVDPTAYNHLAVGESEVISYSYDVTDGNGGSAGQTATVTIEGANDGPVVSAAVSAVAGEDAAAFAVDLLDGASDADTSDTLNVSNLTLVSGDASGVTVDGNSLDVDPTAYNHLAVGESEVISYSYDVTDGNGGSAGQTATITIEGANDGPVVSAAVSAVAGEDAAAFAVDLLDGAGDADTSDTLNVSNLTLVSGDASGVTVDGNSLDVDPTAYNHLAVGESEVVSYSYDVIDGNGGSAGQTATITIEGANDAPVVSAAVSAVAGEDVAAFAVDLLDGASDADTSDTLNVSNLTLVSGDASGVTVNGNSLDVDPTAYNHLAVGESEVVSYSYDVTDGNGGSAGQTATITIEGANDGPVVSAAVSAVAGEDAAAFAVDLLDGASDADTSDTLNVSNLALVSGDASGVTVDGNSLDVDPTAYNHLAVGESEVISYSYDVTDGNGGSAGQTATVTIEGANDGPVVSAAVSAVAGEDAAAFAVDLLDGASDADTSDTLNVSNLTLVSGDASGVTVDGNSLDVDPTAYNHLAVGESEVISYSYDVTDGNGGSAGQTATITIEGANDGPVVSAAVSAVAGEDAAAFAVDLLDGAGDADTSDTLNVSILTLVSGDASGVTVDGNSLDVDPTAYNHLAVGESEVVSYSYDVTDGNGGSAGQTATITIDGANDGPVVSAAVSAAAGEDAAAFAVDLLDGASDADTSDTLNVSNLALVSGDASGVTVDGNSLDIDPTAYNHLAVGESEVVSYSYDVIDGDGGSAGQTATITIDGANDGPVVSAAVSAAAGEDAAAFAVDLLDGASDADTSDTLNVSNLTLVSGDASGVTVDGNSLDVDPTAYNHLAVGESEVVSYSYDVIDGNGGSAGQTATITIEGANDAPVVSAAVSAVAGEDVAAFAVDLLDGASDADTSDTLNVSNLTLVSGDASGVTVNGNSLDVDPTAYNHLAVGESEVVSYSYDVTDGNGGSAGQTATITIEGANDGPVVSAAVSAVAGEDAAAFAVDLLDGASDADTSDTLNVSNLALVSGDASGVTVDGNSLDVDPTAYNHLAVGESEVISYSYDVTDGNGGSAGQTATVTIEGANDGPVVAAINAGTVGEDDSAVVIDLLDGQTDIDGDVLSATNIVVTDDQGGAVAFTDNGDGTISVDPGQYDALNDGESRAVTVSYDVWDGLVGTANTAQLVVEGATDNVPPNSTDDHLFSYTYEYVGSYRVSDGQYWGNNPMVYSGVEAAALLFGGNPEDYAISVNSSSDASTITFTAWYDGWGQPWTVYADDYKRDADPEGYQYPIGDAVSAYVSDHVDYTKVNYVWAEYESAITSEDEVLLVASSDLLANDTDPDGDTLTIASVSGTSSLGATLTLNGDGSISYDPTASASLDQLATGETAQDTFTYVVSDGNGETDTATVTITIGGVNDAPVQTNTVAAQSGFTNEAFSYVLPADLFTDHDEGGGITYAVTLADGSALPTWLEFDPATRTVSYAANAPGSSNVGAYQLKVTAIEDDGQTSSTTFRLTLLDGSLIEGTEGSDNLTGTIQGDLIHGLGGNDTLTGLPGSDVIDGGDGHDYLYGEAGDDVLTGGLGDDRLDGGDGNDNLFGNEGRDYLYGRDGDDVLVGGDESDLLYGENGSDELDGGEGNDTLDGGYGSDHMDGGAGDDTLYGDFDTTSDDTLIGGGGNDRFYYIGYYSSDVVDAGAGDDYVEVRLYGGNESPTVSLGSGADTLSILDSYSYAYQSASIVVTDFSTTEDTVLIDYLLTNRLSGWDGSISPFDPAAGFLQLVQNGLNTLLQVDLNGGGDSWGTLVTFQGVSVGSFSDQNFVPPYPPDGSVPAGVIRTGTPAGERLDGTIGTDTLSGLGGNDQLYGGASADMLDGGDGFDNLYGEAGDDILIGGLDNDSLDGGTGNDDLTGGDGHDNLYGQNGDDTLAGGEGNDYLNGGNGSDHMDGGAGDDRLYADTDSSSDDTLIGGDGNDQFYEVGYNSTDTVDAGAGDDYVRLRFTGGESPVISLGAGADTLDIYNSNGSTNASAVVTDFNVAEDTVVIDYLVNNRLTGWDGSINPFDPAAGFLQLIQNGTDALLQVDYNGGGDFWLNLVTFEGVSATSFTEDNFIPAYPTDGSVPAGITAVGTSSGERLDGTIGTDTLSGLGGNDQLYGGASADMLDGGDGFDSLYGEAGDDILIGGLHNDTLDGGAGNDDLSGDDGHDNLYGQNGDDILAGGEGNDYLNGGNGSDHMDGGAGDDRLYADTDSSSDDTLIGGDGNDLFYEVGYNSTDTVDAGAGEDYVRLRFSGGESPVISLGAGADELDLYVSNGSSNASAVVTDFNVAEDTVLIDYLVSNLLSGWDGASNPFGSGFMRLVQDAADAVLQVDLNGGGNSYANMVTFQNANVADFTGANFLIDAASGQGYSPDGSGVFGQTITGTASGETLDGTAGDDVIDGLDGDDTLTGSQGNDVLDGGTGADALNGGFGQDTLIGGADGDRFVYHSPGEGIDTIIDFTAADGDLLVIESLGFGGGLAAGSLGTTQFVAAAGATANQAQGQFLYDTDTGALSWDADGTAANGPVQFATLDGAPLLSASDFDLM